MNTLAQKPSKRVLDWSSPRVRLIASYMLLVLIAFSVVGVYGAYNAQRSNNYLTSQLRENVLQKARDNLNSTSEVKTLELNNFYIGINKSISQIGSALGNMLSSETTIGNDNYWNASTALERLPNGSWDNDNAEIASIFIPANVELTPDLVAELNAARKLDFLVPSLLETNPDVVALYFGGKKGDTIYYPNIDLAGIVPNNFDITQRPWYLAAAPARNPQKQAVWSEPYLDAALNGLIITNSFPVYDQNGEFRGVTAMDIQLTRITDIVASIRVGETGYAFLLDKNRRIIAMPKAGYADLGLSPETLPLGEALEAGKVNAEIPQEFWNVIAAMAAGKSGFETISINGVEHFIVYKPVSEVKYSLAIVVPSEELLASATAANRQIIQTARNAAVVGILISVGILLVTLFLILQVGNRLAKPLIALTKTAEDIERGNLNALASVKVGGEIGTLAHAFNAMTAQLRDTIANLEQRVAERTQALERRNEQMRATLEVGSAAVSVRDPKVLLDRITHLISQRFGFYHVGIFLLDERQEYAVLRASNSRGGQAMLARGHKLRVGKEGIVGYVTGSGKPRIALDVGEDKVYFQNPDLPQTRSEATLPLIASGKVIGALDVQSTEEAAFDEESLITLRVLADQIAIAIENARLLEESQKALESARRAYGETSYIAWKSLLKEKPMGYAAINRGDILPVSPSPTTPEYSKAMETGETVLSADEQLLYVPIKVTGTSIGILKLKQKDQSRWDPKNIAAINSLANQLGAALESARLYEQIRNQAKKESIVAQVGSRLRETLDIETILQTAAQEIRRSLNLYEAEIRLQAPSTPPVSSPKAKTTSKANQKREKA